MLHRFPTYASYLSRIFMQKLSRDEANTFSKYLVRIPFVFLVVRTNDVQMVLVVRDSAFNLLNRNLEYSVVYHHSY